MKNRTVLLLALSLLALPLVAAEPDGQPSAGVELMLPVNWWRDSEFVKPLALTGEQLQKLDAIQAKQEDVARLQRDSMVAAHELRDALESPKPAAADIVAAGAHLKAMRQLVLEKQIDLLASEREVLTLDQWHALQDQIAQQRHAMRNERGPGMPGGHIPGGRGGHRPGM